MRRTPEQKARAAARHRDRLATDVEYAERKRASARLTSQKYRKTKPEAHLRAHQKYVAKMKGDGLSRVYFAQAASGPIKIGSTTKTPESRVKELQIGNFQELTLLGSVIGQVREEKALHRKFQQARIRGEWFNPTPDLLACITMLLSGQTSLSVI